jgi:hypothetical protein
MPSPFEAQSVRQTPTKFEARTTLGTREILETTRAFGAPNARQKASELGAAAPIPKQRTNQKMSVARTPNTAQTPREMEIESAFQKPNSFQTQ